MIIYDISIRCSFFHPHLNLMIWILGAWEIPVLLPIIYAYHITKVKERNGSKLPIAIQHKVACGPLVLIKTAITNSIGYNSHVAAQKNYGAASCGCDAVLLLAAKITKKRCMKTYKIVVPFNAVQYVHRIRRIIRALLVAWHILVIRTSVPTALDFVTRPKTTQTVSSVCRIESSPDCKFLMVCADSALQRNY